MEAAGEGGMIVTRRTFIGSIAGVGAASALASQDRNGASATRVPLDFHVHLFGRGDGGTGCSLSERQRQHWNFPFFLRLLSLSENGRMDQEFVEALVRQLRASSTQRVVLLAQDGRYDASGRLDLAATDAYVPNDYLFRVVREHPDLFVAGASINPNRRDAIDELDRCASLGARVIKVHPPTQDADPADPRHRPFYARLAGHGLILMVHTGSEHAAAITTGSLSDPARLRPALEAGCTVVAAHAGMGSFLDARPFRMDMFRNLVALAARYPRLYCDTAVLTSIFRWRNLPSLLGETALADRLIYASDWPFTSNALVFWNRLRPATMLSLAAEPNLFQRDAALKVALGLPRDALQRGPEILASVRSPSRDRDVAAEERRR
jgi:predicted TIM-barrel fold metal-dependent hydrolase